MSRSGTIAGLLPGTAFFLMMQDYAPARKIIAGGVPVTLATDFGPLPPMRLASRVKRGKLPFGTAS